MQRWLKIHWIIFTVSAVFICMGICAYFLSSSTIKLPITLKENQNIKMKIFRFMPHRLKASLRFEGGLKNKRPELGQWNCGIACLPPCEPVNISVTVKSNTIEYEAWPASGHGSSITIRNLRPVSKEKTGITFPAGFSEATISITRVGSKLEGEAVTLVISPPVSFKTVSSGYRYLWYFFFWPFMLVILAIYGGILHFYNTRK